MVRLFTPSCFLLAASGLLVSCSTPETNSEVVVSVKDQKMGIYSDGILKKEYAISTSKFGLGDELNSYRTPLGKHEVIAKIGHGLPPGAVLKSRHWNGEVLKPNAPGRDPIVSRILWLNGLENDNSNAKRRYIYIHGTTEESRLGQPASYGCIRMGMQDVVDAFEEVNIGDKVVITKKPLPSGKKPPKPAEAEVLPTPPTLQPPSPAQTPPKLEVPETVLAAAKPASSATPVANNQPEAPRTSLFKRLLTSSKNAEAPQVAEVAPVVPPPAQDPAVVDTPAANHSPSFLTRLLFGRKAAAPAIPAESKSLQVGPEKPAEVAGPRPHREPRASKLSSSRPQPVVAVNTRA
jgi:hypothetical protein